MTSITTVKAMHGWPVRVTQINPIDGKPLGPEAIVPKDGQRDFTFHSGADLLIHEIQPGEEGFDAPEGAGPEDPTASPAVDPVTGSG